jgi:CheY-like chemotaxis protein
VGDLTLRLFNFLARYPVVLGVTMTTTRRVLFVAQKVPDEVTRRTLENRGFAPTFAKDWQKAWSQLAESRFSLVVADLGRHEDAISFIKRVRETESTRTLPVLVLGEWGTGGPTLALSQGADAYERTPIQVERLVTSIERLLTERAVAASQTE